MRDKSLEKNILDLRHSINLTKASAYLALAFSSWIAIFFGTREFYSGNATALILASAVSIMFLYSAFKFFRSCEEIQFKIKSL